MNSRKSILLWMLEPIASKRFFSFLVGFLFLSQLFGQDTTSVQSQTELENKIETIGGLTEDEVDFTNIFDQVNYYKENPINLNSTDRDELNRLNLLSDYQVNTLLDHIAKNGKLISIHELQSINGFELETIFRLLPYVRVSGSSSGSKFSFQDVWENQKHMVLMRYQRVMQEQSGFADPDSSYPTRQNSRYLGSPEKIYARYKLSYKNNFSAGFTVEKDAGETFLPEKVNLTNRNDTIRDSLLTKYGLYDRGFDYFSAHIFYKSKGFVRVLALGDYELQYGQGLAMWSGLAFSKSSDGLSIRKNALGIKPYASVNENAFMRGGATAIGYKNFQLDVFYSQNKIDGNVVTRDTLDDRVLEISSFQETGYHRTPGELEDRISVGLQLYGSHLGFKNRRLTLGLTAVNTVYNSVLVPSASTYNKFDFSGKENFNASFDYGLNVRNFSFFGEIARSANGGLAIVNGFLASLDQNVSIGLLHRDYQKDYQALFSNGFGESAGTQNEKGTYLGLSAKPMKSVTFSGYYDVFSYPWLKFYVDAPSNGYEYITQLTYSPAKKTEMYVRYSETVKEENAPSTSGEVVTTLKNTYRKKLRFNVNYKVSASFNFGNRLELGSYEKEDQGVSNGFMIYQDVHYKPLSMPVSFSLRYALFDTDDYNSLIYAYESDVLYAYSVSSYYYKGSRFYLTVRWHLARGVDCWVRYAQTVYSNQQELGSGNDVIQGNLKSEIKAQLRFTF